MNLVRIGFSAILPATSLAACANATNPEETEAKLKTLTLEATGGAATQTVMVSDVQATGSRRAWTATVDGKVYSCDTDNFFRLPACEPVGQPGA